MADILKPEQRAARNTTGDELVGTVRSHVTRTRFYARFSYENEIGYNAVANLDDADDEKTGVG